MYKIYTTNRFEKDLKLCKINHKKTEKLLGFFMIYNRFTHLSGFMEV